MIFSLRDFLAESNRIEGIHRAPTGEEVAITAQFLARDRITISALAELVAVYQPHARLRCVAGLDVVVGSHFPPRGGVRITKELGELLDGLLKGYEPAYRVHLIYETLHPFTDGNGRSGRALWLWQMGGIERAPLGFLHHFYYQTLQFTRA